jgi:ACT domain-containing protein
MIVLDSIRRTDSFEIQIPPFHRGHLGLIPETEVHVALIAPSKDRGSRHCEVVVSPFRLATANMALLKCTLHDSVGVVGRLVSAIAALDINIVTLESTVLNHSDHHLVNVLLDFSTSILHEGDSSERTRKLYANLGPCFPTQDDRFVRLFESLAGSIADVWTMREVGKELIPDLELSWIANRPWLVAKDGLARVDRHESNPDTRSQQSTPVRAGEQSRTGRPTESAKRSSRITITLPPEVGAALKQRLNTGFPLHYLPFSDTDERTLRIFFPTPELVPRIFHVAFFHNDEPGALSALLHTIAAGNFNILASLLRKQSGNRSVWEGILEYRGKTKLPTESDTKRVEWIINELATSNTGLNELARFGVEVGTPLYPRPTNVESIRRPLPAASKEAKSRRMASVMERIENIKRKLRRSASYDEQRQPLPQRSATVAILERIEQHGKHAKPSIFVSYPVSAGRHYELVFDRLHRQFDMKEYSRPDGEIILAEVTKRIQQSDFFLGIWHHDERMPVGDGKYSVSIWMPFEYGIATAAGKPCHIVHSELLDDNVWKKINPSVGTPAYRDIDFQSSTLDDIAHYCVSHWATRTSASDD